jgi:hypothetical protein
MTVAYLGFTAGPALVGLIAGQSGLRVALGVVAGLAVLLAVSVAGVSRLTGGARAPALPGGGAGARR